MTLVEAGCGAGNTIFPLLEESTNLFVWACDHSPRAVELVKVFIFVFPILRVGHSSNICTITTMYTHTQFTCTYYFLALTTQQHKLYHPSRCHAFVCDISMEMLTPNPIPPDSCDFATMIFVASAIPPSRLQYTIENVVRVT